MHKIILPFLLLFISYSSISQQPSAFENNFSIWGTVFPTAPSIIKKNGIKKAMRFKYNNKECTDSSLIITNVFDTAGNLSENLFSSQGRVALSITFAYDNQNRLIKQYTTKYGKKILTDSFVISGNDSLEDIAETFFALKLNPSDNNIGATISGTSYQTKRFDQQHQLTEYVSYDSNHIVQGMVKYVYEDGLLQMDFHYGKDDTLQYEHLYKYKFSKKGRKVESWYLYKGQNYKTGEYDYNIYGQCTRTYNFPLASTSAGIFSYADYTYNSDGTVFSRTSQSSNSELKQVEKFYYFK
jgi:hypothetical protein